MSLKAQAKEIERLNSVYVKLLEGAGVKLFGARTGLLFRRLTANRGAAPWHTALILAPHHNLCISRGRVACMLQRSPV